MIVNVVVVLAVAAVLGLCVRSLVKHGEDCADCSIEGTCSVHQTGVGKCSVAENMVADAEKALDNASLASK